MDVKELIGEFAKGAKKGAKKTASPFKPEVKLNVQFNDDMREDLEHIMRNLDSITKTRLKEINDSINPLIKESVAKMEWRWKVTQYLLVFGFVVNGAIAIFAN